MAVQVPPPPYNVPMADENGFVKDVWAAWFRQVFSRIGGSVASSLTDVATQTSVNLLGTRVSTLETDVTALDPNGLSQGRQL